MVLVIILILFNIESWVSSFMHRKLLNLLENAFRSLSIYPLVLLCFFSQHLNSQEYVGNIDGDLEEDHWYQATLYSNFQVTQPFSLKTPSYTTDVLVHSDDHGLYIGFINQQSKSSRIAHTSLRDEEIKSDFNEVIIDFDSQGKRGYGFKVSRNNAAQDSVWRDKNREETDWNGEWLHGVKIDEEQWQTEIFIPWSVVVSIENKGFTRDIKLYFSRWHQGKRQRSSYPATDRSQLSFMDEFNTYSAVIGYKPQVDYFPYLTLDRNLLLQDNNYKFGMDVFWKPNNNQQINLSLNPDFGQVESEDLVINFNAIETFESEKRPFFRENNDLFDIWGPETLRVIHTPRIGGDDYEGDSRDIDAAVRLTQVGEKFDVSLLSAFEKSSRQLNGRDFFALRGQYKSANWTTGFIQTYVDRPDIKRKAITTSVDAFIEVNNQLFVTGQFIRSEIDHSTNTDMKSANINDYGWWIKADYQASDVWSNELAILNYGQQFDISDFGFVKQVDRKQFEYKTSYEWPEINNSLVRDIKVESSFTAKNNNNNDDLPKEFELDVTLAQSSSAIWELETVYISAGDDDLITRGGNVAYLPKQTELVIGYTTAQNHWLQLEISAGLGKQGLDGDYNVFEITPSVQIGEWINMELEVEYQAFDNWLIWLGDDDDDLLEDEMDDFDDDNLNLLGDFSMDELSIAFNVSVRIGDKHELRLKLESVSLEANANQVFEVATDNQIYLSDEEDPESFSESEFAIQLRYRYEIGPLSELYFVYSRGGEQEIDGLPSSRRKFLNSAVNHADLESLVVKIKYHF